MGVAVLGSINMDVVLYVNDLPRAGETVRARELVLFPGGKGANQAIASAHCGAPTVLLGAVGDDAHGRQLLENLRDSGVSTAGVNVLPGRTTGSAYICVATSGENSIVVLAGANHDYEAGRLALPAVPEGAGPTVRLSQFEMPLPAVEDFLGRQREDGSLRMLNPAPALREGRKLLDLADIVIVNETELEVYAGRPLAKGVSSGVAAGIARELLARPGQWIVVTLGARGAVAVRGSDELFAAGIPVEAIDTTGAGDCYCGALAAQLSLGRSMRDALDFANAAASIAVTRRGAASSMPWREEVEAVLASRSR